MVYMIFGIQGLWRGPTSLSSCTLASKLSTVVVVQVFLVVESYEVLGFFNRCYEEWDVLTIQFCTCASKQFIASHICIFSFNMSHIVNQNSQEFFHRDMRHEYLVLDDPVKYIKCPVISLFR